jgi:hypothetical protein
MGEIPDIRLVFLVIETAPDYFARFISCTAVFLAAHLADLLSARRGPGNRFTRRKGRIS